MVALKLVIVLACLCSGCADNPKDPTPHADTTPPGRVEDLAVSVREEALTLTWTAPGDDGFEGRAAAYAVRYSPHPIDVGNWDSAAVVSTVSPPKSAGQREELVVRGLSNGVWNLALQVEDEVHNRSALSNNAVGTIADRLPPGAITDLRVVSMTVRSITLEWTAPGGDGDTGTAWRYEMRVSPSQILEDTWEEALPVENLPEPARAGTLESAVAESLEPATLYYVALKAADQALNWSPLSNVVSTPTVDVLSGVVTDLTVCPGYGTTLSLVWTAPNAGGGTSRVQGYDVRYNTVLPDDSNWQACLQAEGALEPGDPGAIDRLTVDVPQPSATYYFAIKSKLHEDVWSRMSNAAGGSADLTQSPRRLTYTVGPGLGVFAPQLSRDGRWIAFEYTITGAHDIYVMSLACDPMIRVTDHGDADACPTWSPDGAQVAYTSRRDSKDELWVADVFGEHLPRRIASHDGNVYTPAWSPDGSRIAYAVEVTGGVWIYDVLPDGTGNRPLVSDASMNGEPRYSPDGRSIVFNSRRSGSPDVWLASSEGGQPEQLTSDTTVEGGAVWSPDGSRIVYYSNRSGSFELWDMSSSGSDQRQLTFDQTMNISPSVSPDNRSIIYVSRRSGVYEIWMMDYE